jgi:hypothetical protein
MEPASLVHVDGDTRRGFAIDGPPRATTQYALAVDKLSEERGVLAPGSAPMSEVARRVRWQGAWVRISGPRQSGKTTAAWWLLKQLDGKTSDDDRTLRVEAVSFEGLLAISSSTSSSGTSGEASSSSSAAAPSTTTTELYESTPWEAVDKAILAGILTEVMEPYARKTDEVYVDLLARGRALSKSLEPDEIGNRTSKFLRLWAKAERERQKDLVLIIDEMDALPLRHLLHFLHVLRKLYLRRDKAGNRVGMWGAVFITHLPLAILPHDTTAIDVSPINTFNVAYTPPFFPPLAVHALLLTHREQTGQGFEEGVVEEVVKQSGGHPWLVNMILGMATKAAAKEGSAVAVSDVLNAVNTLRKSSYAHIPLQTLRDRVHDLRVQHAIAHVLDPRRETALQHARPGEDLEAALAFTEALGLIRIQDRVASFTCPLYESILTSKMWSLIRGAEVGVEAGQFLTKSGYVNMTALVKMFGMQGRAAVAHLLGGSGDWRERDAMAECTIQVLFSMFVAAALPRWAHAARSGRGASDVLVVCKPPGQVTEQRAVVEIKFWRRSTKGSMLAMRQAAYQVAFDGYRLSATERHVLIIDAQDVFWAGQFRGSDEIWTTGRADGLRMGLVVSMPELACESSVTVHGFGWTGSDAHATAKASEATDSSSSAAAAAAASGGSESRVGAGDREVMDEEVEDTAEQAAMTPSDGDSIRS